MITLVVNNESKQKITQTCRTQCQLFDEITNSCSIKRKVDVDNPSELMKCGHVLLKEEVLNTTSYFSAGEEYPIEDEDIFQELWGERFKKETSSYPLKPDSPSKCNDAIWYVSPDQTFGCWIINKSSKKFFAIPKNGNVEYGWSKRVYKSPYPLHDHKASESLCSKIAWFIEEDGFGQYVLLLNGNISQISQPRPKGWKAR